MERKKTTVKTKSSGTELANDNRGFAIRIGILFILHLVGLVGFSLSDLVPYFQLITPIHLVIISIVLFWEKSCLEPSFWLFFSVAYLIGFFSEMFGVKSGLLFGYYSYTESLGPAILDVPMVIGLLWAGVSYACNQASHKLFPHAAWISVPMAALFMVLFDYMIEPFAVGAGLWVWHQSVIPAYNYLSWFIIGLIISIVYQYTLHQSKENQVAPYFLLSQMLFFLAYQLINNNFTFSPFD